MCHYSIHNLWKWHLATKWIAEFFFNGILPFWTLISTNNFECRIDARVVINGPSAWNDIDYFHRIWFVFEIGIESCHFDGSQVKNCRSANANPNIESHQFSTEKRLEELIKKLKREQTSKWFVYMYVYWV